MIRKLAIAAALAATLGAASSCFPSEQAGAAKRAPLLPEREWAMIRQIAVNYDLDNESTWLLAAIRRHENGRPGLEFGIGGPMDSGHPSHRYRDGFKSFYIQGSWAAGTVKNNYNGDIYAFGKRYWILARESMYHWGTSCSFIVSTQPSWKPPRATLPFRTASMILKASLGSMPMLMR